MKPHLIYALIILLFTCCKYDPNCSELVPKHIYLDSGNLVKNPYYLNQVDSLIFLSTQYDTVILKKNRQHIEWVGGDFRRRSLDCGGTMPSSYYEEKFSYFKPIIAPSGWNSYFTIHHAKLGFSDANEYENLNMDNTILIDCIYQLRFYLKDYDVDNPQSKHYIAKQTFNGHEFKDLNWTYANFTDSLRGKLYYNKEYGVVHIIDKINDKQWTLITP